MARESLRARFRREKDQVQVRLGLHRWSTLEAPRVVVYHDVGPRPNPLLEGLYLHVDLRRFEAQVRMLQKAYVVLPLEEWVAMWRERCLPPRALAITFDDGYRGAFEHAAPILKRRGLPATFFLNADFVGNRVLFWRCLYVEAVRALGAARVVEIVRKAWGGDAPGLDERTLRVWLRDRFDPDRVPLAMRRALAEAGRDEEALAREHRPFADWQEWATLREQGFRFGNHTADHALLAACRPEAQRSTIQRGRAAIVERLGERWVPFAWPHGHPGSWDDSSLEIVKSLDHPCALAGAGSPCGYEGNLFSIGRVPAHDEDAGMLWRRLQEA